VRSIQRRRPSKWGSDTSRRTAPSRTFTSNVKLMAMTLRLTEERDRLLETLADSLHVSKNSAAAQAIEIAAPRPSHPDFVAASTARQLGRYADLMTRLAYA